MSFNRLAKRLFSTIMSKRIIITDPCYVRNREQYDSNMKPELQSTSTTPGTFVSIPVSASLFQSLIKAEDENHEIASRRTNESFFSFGKQLDFSKYELLGTHMSDSGMTCIVEENCFADDQDDALAVDWDDFVMTTLNDPNMQASPDDFPIFLFFSKIPEEDMALTVYGHKESGSSEYSGIIMRAASMSSKVV